jgi:hypothetical protein
MKKMPYYDKNKPNWHWISTELPNSKTWEIVTEYQRDPIPDLQLGILLDEEYGWDEGTGIFLIHSLKHDTKLIEAFFEYNTNPEITRQAAIKFARALGLLEGKE